MEIPLQLCTLMMYVFFGTNLLLYTYFHLLKPNSNPSEDHNDELSPSIPSSLNDKNKSNIVKKLSDPFTGTFQNFVDLTSDLNITGFIMGLSYVCEKHPIFPHSEKHYDRDLFMFICLLFFGVAWYTRKPTKDLTLLSRDQTEEWKGWMQFIFLLYHYFHAEEVYNSVRVMITCYVWMTGFGNFSFFYFKRDFGWLRVVQMLWRLNFSVILLMLWHGNTYILYYICPLHTFYFLMTYLVMYIGHEKYNHSKWGVRIKIFLMALFMYLLWDINKGSFDILWGFLGTSSVIGASRGSVWEWYFRTSLDKYSAVFGMVFACNYPLTEQYFKEALNKNNGVPLLISAVIIGSLAIWWFYDIYSLEKLEYNLVHNYFAFIPLLAYIFFRNITPKVRSNISMSLHTLGKTTLETYLLQHHLWLTSNAKTLLTIVPGNPWLNFAFASIIFVILSKELYRMTMNLRGMMLPDDGKIAIQNIKGMSVVFIYVLVLSTLLWLMNLGLGGAFIGIGITFALCIYSIHKHYSDIGNTSRFKALNKFGVMQNFAYILSAIVIFFGLVVVVSSFFIAPVSKSHACQQCLHNLGVGTWKDIQCDSLKPNSSDPYISIANSPPTMAHCEMSMWQWNDNYGQKRRTIVDNQDNKIKLPRGCRCNHQLLTKGSLSSIFSGKNIAFLGDSNMRNAFYTFNGELDSKFDYQTMIETTKYHEDMHHDFKTNSGSSICNSFHWTPYIQNVTSIIQQYANGMTLLSQKDRQNLPALRHEKLPDMIVVQVGLWDVLHNHKPDAPAGSLPPGLSQDIADLIHASYKLSPKRLNDDGTKSGTGPVLLFIQPLTIRDDTLQSELKRKYMTESTIEAYRTLIRKSKLSEVATALVESKKICEGQTKGVVDGVHYKEGVYHIMAQVTGNVGKYIFGKIPTIMIPRATGSMSLEWHGLLLLILLVISLCTMDNFMGIGWVSLYVFKQKVDWEDAYHPILASLGIARSTDNGVDRCVDTIGSWFGAVSVTGIGSNSGDSPEGIEMKEEDTSDSASLLRKDTET